MALPVNPEGKHYTANLRSGRDARIKALSSRQLATYHVVWEVQLPAEVCPCGHAHIVDFWHGVAFGKRKLKLDGKKVVSARRLLDVGGLLPFELHDIVCHVEIAPAGLPLTYKYTLYVDGQAVKRCAE